MTLATPPDLSRVLSFEGIHNFRDSGGYATADGGRLRTGVVLRSAQHKDATDADLERIAGLSLASVIDLRSDRERELFPCRRPEGFSAEVRFVSDRELLAAPHVAAAEAVSDPASAAARMVRSYRMLPFRPVFLQAMHHYFSALSEADGPVLIHCLAGKDRTGIAVAVLHRALGVAREDWMADYLLTNVAGNIEARIAAGAVQVRSGFGRDIDDDTVRVIMSVAPEFIEAAFDEMDERHGGLAGYLGHCGIDEGLVERVRARLVE